MPSGQTPSNFSGSVSENFIFASSMRAASASRASSPSVSGVKSARQRAFCSICSTLDMPLSTASTPSRLAPKSSDQSTAERPGAASRSSDSTSEGRLARVPPLTASITTTCLP